MPSRGTLDDHFHFCFYFCFFQKRKTFVWTLYPRALQPETAVSLLHYWWFLHLPKGESLPNLLNFWTPFIINLIMSKKVCCQTKTQSSVFFISPQKKPAFHHRTVFSLASGRITWGNSEGKGVAERSVTGCTLLLWSTCSTVMTQRVSEDSKDIQSASILSTHS